jgi:hypothetical protein
MALDYYIHKIQEKRKQTPFREFVLEIASWRPMTFYKNSGFVSRFPETDRCGRIVDHATFEETRDNPFQKEYILTNNFFDQFQDLFKNTSFSPTYQVGGSENSEYSDMVLNGKNIYLSTISVYDCENIFYSFATREGARNVYDSVMVFENSENIYASQWVIASSNIFFSKYINNGYNLRFCSNCIGCKECIWCSELENKSYCIDNVQYDKGAYGVKKTQILANKSLYHGKINDLQSNGINTWSSNVSGSFLSYSQDVDNGYYSYNIHKARNIMYMWGAGDNEYMYDIFVGWAVQGKHFYAVQWAGNSEHIYCSIGINDASHIYYSMYCSHCSFCIGCIWLKNKQFCIFNKQYTKEERHQKVEEIFAQMDKAWTLGNFFPGSINPFYFNDTAAYLIDPSFTKEEVTNLGYLRRDEPVKVDIPSNVEVVKTITLGQYEWYNGTNRAINPSILNKIIMDEQGNYYRIVKMEYDFLMKYGLPLPRKHWLERLKVHFDLWLEQWH